MDGLSFSETAQHWVNLVLIWIGFGTLAGLLAKAVLPGRDPSGTVGTLAVDPVMDWAIGNMPAAATTGGHGFDGLKDYVQHFPPEVAESVTGVPAGTVRELARRVAGATGACPVMYTGLEYSNSGIQAIRAVLTLFALAGQLDVPGGIGLAMRGTHFPIHRGCNQVNPDLDLAVARDRFPLYSNYRGESHAGGLVDSVLRGDPYRIRGLIVHGASLLTSWPQTPVWRETLAGFESPTPLVIDRPAAGDDDEDAHLHEQLLLSRETTAALEQCSRKHQLTLNTIVQGAWGLLLGRYSGERDVVYGTAVSGRSVSADGAAVHQVVQDDEGLGDDSVGSRLVEIGHEADATGVVLEGGVVEAFRS